MQNRSREDLAWAAGLWEGEGCFTGVKNRVPQATMSMTDEDVMRRFAVVIGFGTIYAVTKPAPRKNCWMWQSRTFESFQATVALLWPWLHERRRARAAELLLGYRARLALMEIGGGTYAGHPTIAGQMFGKRARDLTPDEERLYNRTRMAAWRSARAEQVHED